MFRGLFVLAAVAVVAVAAVISASRLNANEVDCLSHEYLADIRILEELPVSSRVQEDIARQAILSNAVTPGAEIQTLKYGIIASDSLGMQDGIPAFLAVVPDNRGPRAVSVPIGHPGLLADSPCEIVVVSAEGEYLFSHVVHTDFITPAPQPQEGADGAP